MASLSFRILGLDPAPFRPLYGLPDAALAALGVERHVADAKSGYPDRVELRDAEPGERVLLLNHTHQPAGTPYRASHAIFVREGAELTYDEIGVVPEPLRLRLISLRGFDAGHRMVDADVIDGQALEGAIGRFFANPLVRYLQAHFAKRGCYAARIEPV